MKVTPRKKPPKPKKPKKPKGPKPKKAIYTCPHCGKQFADNSSWSCHIQIHSTELPYSCELCDYKCKIKKYLSSHMKKAHTKPEGHQCPVCGKCFHFDCKLRNHMRVHTGEKPYKCGVCGKAFSSSYSLNGHKLIHTGEKPFQCLYCNYACRDNSTIRRHMERHQGITKDYPCSICNKNFKRKDTLQFHVEEVHLDLDTRKHPCELCDKKFKSKAALKTHVNTVHNRMNRIRCEICGGRVTKNNIQSHMRRHIDVRPYKCSFKSCGRRFKDKGDLKKHSRIHYPHRQYLCNICNRRFPRRFRYEEHMNTHTKKNYVQCHHCGEMYPTKKHLCKHIKSAHGPNSKSYICDICGLVKYTKKTIIKHLKYGHGTENDTICQICKKDYEKYIYLKEHYLNFHNIVYNLLEKKKEGEIRIKDEPIEEVVATGEPPEFIYEVKVQKQEDIDATIIEVPIEPRSPQTYVIDSDTIIYSKKVLSEDISRNLLERENVTEDAFGDFFIGHVLNKPEDVVDMPKDIVDKKKKEEVERCLEKLLLKARIRKQCKVLEKMRRRYNKRIKAATNIGNKKEPKKAIRYFKTPEDNNTSSTPQTDININGETSSIPQKNVNGETEKSIENSKVDNEARNNTALDEIDNNISNDRKASINDTNENDDKEIGDNHKVSNNETNENGDQETGDKNTNKGKDAAKADDDKQMTKNNISDEDKGEDIGDDTVDEDREVDEDDANDSDYKDSDLEDNGGRPNKNGRLKFNTHQCYICFKLFKTKNDLKKHCQEHFDICNDKMLKKCPFCGYVTNLQINKHIKLVHNITIDVPYYSRVKERETQNGSKYVFEIDKNCDLEIIPSISNLNKIASMKIDEKNRENKNLFTGITKLVRKGKDWVVEKKPFDINNEYILPVFSREEYQSLNYAGDTYLEGIRSLSILGKKRGVKILYPCEGCDKICLTMSALKLHNRKHEANPKRFKPKVWKHKLNNNSNSKSRKSNGKSRNGNSKSHKSNSESVVVRESSCNTKSNAINGDPYKRRRLEVFTEKRTKPENGDGKLPNRFADPNPVKNKHKCDKELIEFYKNNIKGGDIEFWQFLKIFNRMTRENVNDFKDLENRYDFGMHNIKNIDESDVVSPSDNIEEQQKESVSKNSRVISKKIRKFKKNKAFTRAIMISKKEYLKRIEIKNEMRRRLQENKS